MLQRRAKRLARLETLIGILGQRLERGALDARRNIRIVPSGQRRRRIHVIRHHLKIAFALEWQMRREQLEQRHAQTVNVRANVHGHVANLLGRHVRDRAHARSGRVTIMLLGLMSR